MNARQKRRLGLAVAVSVGVAAGVALMLYAFQQNLLYFYSPSQVAAGLVEPQTTFRLGGWWPKTACNRRPARWKFALR